jgi:chitodextrinase
LTCTDNYGKTEKSANNNTTQPFVIVLPLVVNNPPPNPPTPTHLATSNETAYTQVDRPVDIQLLANDSIPHAVLTFTHTEPKSGATLVPINASGVYKYSPNQGFQGTDTFSFKATDDRGQTSNVSTAIITVTPPNGLRAMIIPPTQTVKEGSNVTLNGSQSKGNVIAYQWTQKAGPSTHIVHNTSKTASFIAPPLPDRLKFDLTVTDKNNQTNKASTNISVAARPPPTQMISITADRNTYSVGEFVQISGKVNDNTGKPIDNESVIIRVHRISTTDGSVPRLSDFYKKLGLIPLPQNASQQLISALPINGFYNATFMNTVDEGTYDVTATLSQSSSSWTTFGVEHPLATFSAVSVMIAIASLFLLLIVPFAVTTSVRLIEISNFILMSSIVVSLLLALLFADTELGPNSIVGLIFKHSVDAKGRLQQGGQVMINAGGSQRDNYANGIQIPVYALALGLAGGYLRYLYDTWRNRKDILGELDEIKEQVYKDGYRFFPRKPRREWLPREPTIFTKIFRFFVGKPLLAEKKETKEENERKKKEENEKKEERREIGSRQRHYYVFEVLKRVGLVLLSPLLASAMWLFLSQVGLQNQNIMLGAVSFSIGLVTEEAVKFIIKLATRIFGVAEEALTPKTDTAKTDTAKTDTAKTDTGDAGIN